jgi:hypothetical protein
MVAVLVAFISYRLYQITLLPTVGLALLTAFDPVVAALTWREYRRRWSPPRPPASAGQAAGSVRRPGRRAAARRGRRTR